MPPTSSNQTNDPTPLAKPPKRSGSTFSDLRRRANSVSGVIALLVSVLIIGGFLGYLVSSSRNQAKTTVTPTVTSLTDEQIRQLTQIGSNLGSSNQVLTVAANTLFRQKVDVIGDISIGGKFNANGPVTLSQLNITGNSILTGLNVGSNLTVAGTSTFQNSVSIANLLAVNGGLNVSGTASVSALNASSISTRTISISGPLSIGHLVSQGLAPNFSSGSVGSGGTVNISGNDTAGTLNINTGSGAVAGTLATVTFRAAFASTPHVVLTALTPSGATAQVYVTTATTGFAVHLLNPSSSAVYAFSYIVVQ